MLSGQRAAACVIATPAMLWPTSTTGSGWSASASQMRAAYASSVTAATGVVSSPEPGRSNVCTVWPAADSSATSGSQHQAPWNAPWTSTYLAMPSPPSIPLDGVVPIRARAANANADADSAQSTTRRPPRRPHGQWPAASAFGRFAEAVTRSGGGGIRTLVRGLTPETVFETAAFNHSATPPTSDEFAGQGTEPKRW